MVPEKQASVHRNGAETNSNRQRWPLLIALLVLVLALILVVMTWWMLRSSSGAGSRIVPMGEMTADEARAALDGEVEKSRITVSLAPAPILDAAKSLAVNFVVVPGNNGYSERFEIVQGDRVVYTSDVVAPGSKIEAVTVPDAHAGKAIATVYAVDGDGSDAGNPVSVELEIVE